MRRFSAHIAAAAELRRKILLGGTIAKQVATEAERDAAVRLSIDVRLIPFALTCLPRVR